MDPRTRTLLICDDDPDMRRLLAAMAKGRYEVLEASDGRAALALIRRRTPDLVLLDLTMPGLDGLRTLRLLRRLRPSLPVTMLTAVGDLGKARRALALGARAYVTKPIAADPEEFWSLVDPLPRAADAPPWRVAASPR